MLGIKAHTHEERVKIVGQLIPLVQNIYGHNFVALAADGSYARGEDTDYSDLELIVFVEELPEGKASDIRKIVGGMLIVVVPETKASYLEKYIEVSDVWYASGAGKLLPLVNKPFIDEINNFVPTITVEKCLEQIRKRWPFFQEITAKVLNNVQQKDTSALALSFTAMVKEVLVLLSFLNATPYITLGTYISQALNFPIQPKGFEELILVFTTGNYERSSDIRRISENVFTELEKLLLEKNVSLYSQEL